MVQIAPEVAPAQAPFAAASRRPPGVVGFGRQAVVRNDKAASTSGDLIIASGGRHRRSRQIAHDRSAMVM